MMTPDQFTRVREVFLQASELDEAAQAVFVEEKCSAEPEIRSEVERLLRAERSGSDDKFPDIVDALLTEDVASTERIGGYRLLRLLGSGGMGVVYEAEQKSPQRIVALKVLRSVPWMDGVTRRFVRREAAALARLVHPAIAVIYDAGIDGTWHFFALERVEGVPLTTFARERSLSVAQRLKLFATICDGVHHAHQRGVIHRDLKPSNILVTLAGEPKILDFGIARIIDPEIEHATCVTEPGVIMGTLPYMSPEQARGDAEQVDTRTDIYSLGIVLYELLTDRPPFELGSKSLPEAARIVCESPPPPPSSIAPALRGDLETIVLQAIDKQPERRYPSVAAFADDVRRFLADQPVQARPQSTAYQIKKLIQRHRGAFGLATAFLVILCALTIYALSQAVQARDQRDLADARRTEIERVAGFQATMLRSADPERMAGFLMKDLRRRVEASLSRENAQPEVRAEISAALDEVLARVNLTDTAAALVGTELLDQSSRTAERDFKEQPMTVATLRLNIGQAFQALGLYDRAVAELEAVVEVRTRHLGPTSEATLESIHALGVVLAAQGRYDLAMQKLSSCLDGRRRLLGETHHVTLDVRADLANVLRELGQAPRAAEEHRSILEILKRKQPVDDAALLESLIQLGWSLKAMDEFEEAERCFREAVSRATSEDGEESFQLVAATNGLAMVFEARGQLEECRTVLADLAIRMRRLYGSDHPETLKTLTNLGRALEMVGRQDEALKVLNEAYEGCRIALGPSHPETLRVLARIAQNTRDRRESEVLWRQAHEGYRTLYGSEHPSVYGTLRMLATKIAAQGRIDEALPLCREAHAGLHRLLGPDHSDTLAATNDLGFILALAQRYAEAESVFREALETFRLKFGPVHVSTAAAALNVGLSLHDQGRTYEAVPLLTEAVDGFRATHGATHPQTLAAVGDLLNAYIELGDLSAARETLASAYDSLEDTSSTREQRGSAFSALTEYWTRLYEETGNTSDAELATKCRERATAMGYPIPADTTQKQ